jgi:hypothetical protein
MLLISIISPPMLPPLLKLNKTLTLVSSLTRLLLPVDRQINASKALIRTEVAALEAEEAVEVSVLALGIQLMEI